MKNLFKIIKKNYSFKKTEIKNMIFLTLAISVMMSYRSLINKTTLNFAFFFNFVNSFLIVGLALFVHESAHKIVAYSRGYSSEHKPWFPALILGLVLTLFTNGYFFYFGFGIVVFHLAIEGMGKTHYGINLKDISSISLAGPLANLVFAGFFKIMGLISPNPLIYGAMVLNLMFACFNMLPLPWVDGGNIIYVSRAKYVLYSSFVFIFSGLLFFLTSIILSFIVALGVAVISFIYWEIEFEGTFG